jgi:hypothetical protein
MKIKIQVVIETEGSNEVAQEVMQLKRGALRVEEFGLTVAEAKTVLQGVQQTMVEQQSVEYPGGHPNPANDRHLKTGHSL